jgi:hypothetical protein
MDFFLLDHNDYYTTSILTIFFSRECIWVSYETQNYTGDSGGLRNGLSGIDSR